MIMKLKIKNISDNPMPCYKNPGDAGMDIYSNEDMRISPFNWKLISTGIYLEIPEGYEVQVRSRSGLALKWGITVLNSPGTIDSGYRGEVGVILRNHDHRPYTVKKGDRIAQLVMAAVVTADIEEITELTNTERSDGGFGSTGK
jgi:dUTP pyrophosphatase